MTKPFDPLALRVGLAYRRGLAAHVEAGKLLAEKKASLRHGGWLPWLATNADALGFDSDRTAQRLMKLAEENPTLASDLVLDAESLRRRLWGHNLPRTRTSDPELPISFECYTPRKYVALVKTVFGGNIDLDVASCREANKHVQALEFYDLKRDALLPSNPWKGKIYGNVPFQSRYMTPFTDKLIEQRACGNVTEAVWCSGGFTDAAWFHKLLVNADAMCLVRGRSNFILPQQQDDPLPGPNFGVAFSYLGRKHRKFADTFKAIGTIVRTVR